MTKSPKVSLLILNWNGLNFTRKCIHSLLKTTYKNFEIILLDNGSQRNEAELLKKEFHLKKIKILRSEKNVGYAAGMNIVYTNSSGEYIMILNNDMEFEKNWLTPLVRTLKSYKKIGGCQPKIKDLRNKSKFEYSVAAGGFIDIFGYPFARGRIFSHVEEDKGQYNQKAKVCWAGVMLIKRSVIKQVGFFDPIYFNYTEDVDLSYRIYGAGYEIVYEPSSIVYHYGGAVLGKSLSRKMFYIHRNHLILILKNWETRILIGILIPRIILDSISFFYYLFSGYWKISIALLCAYISLIHLIPKIIQSRMRVQKKLSINPLRRNMPIYKRSVVLDYFIFKKKLFNEIIK